MSSSLLGKARLATDAEQAIYPMMPESAYESRSGGEIVGEHFFNGGTRNGKPAVDFDNDGIPDMFSCQQQIKNNQTEWIKCSAFSSQRRAQRSTDGWLFSLPALSFGDLSHSIKIVEMRSGDIDGDGDNDIAARVTGGAIFVWHNNLKKPSK